MMRQESSPQESDPFVGPDSIQAGQHLFGRDREVRDLVDLLIAKRITLLHSPSGAGKSSLVNAGLIPALEDELFEIYPVIRVNKEARGAFAKRADSGEFNRYIYSAIRCLEQKWPKSERLDASKLGSISFSDYLDQRAEELADDDAVVLIFDQFEEILTIDPIDLTIKKDFFEQVGQALRDRSRWAIFVMREDYVGSLDPYLHLLPTQLSVRMRLDLLTESAARQAIRRPRPKGGGQETDSVFDTFTEAAALKLAEDLRQIRVQNADGTWDEVAGPYVEPVQLQVVCKRLWEKRPEGVAEIDVDLVEESGTVDEALAGYYADNMVLIAEELDIPEWRIRDWFGRKLITALGIRGQVMRGARESEKLENEAIQRLMDVYLVREERRRGITWYELAHDRLVDPIRQDNKRWQLTSLSPYYAQAARWNAQDRPRNMLLEENQLLELEQWERQKPGSLTYDEEAYLEAGRDLREQSRTKDLEGAERQTNLDQIGWGVIFAQNAGPGLYDALSELLSLRRTQATTINPEFYKEFAYQRGETAREFLARHGISTGPVEPDKIPYYLLIVGSPKTIPFDFQYELDLQYAVGRIYFEELEEYANYARSVVAAEKGLVKLPRRATFFGVAHPDDRATMLSADYLVQPMYERSRQAYRDWELILHLREEATKDRLSRLLTGEQTPALLFAAGHGMEFPAGDPRQLTDQGAFICQDYPGPGNWQGELSPDFYFSATDLSDDANLIGMVAFFASAYSAGVPASDDFAHIYGKSKTMADNAFISRLPQRLLGHPNGGALAVCGHIDRWWITEGGSLEMPVYSDVVRRLLDGHTVGSAMEVFDQRYAIFASRVSERLRRQMVLGEEGDGSRRDSELTELLTAMIDARNYIIIGDPAVRLPVAEVEGAITRPTMDVITLPPEGAVEELTAAPDAAVKHAPSFRPARIEAAYAELEIRLRRSTGQNDDVYNLEMRFSQPQADIDMVLADDVRVEIDRVLILQHSLDLFETGSHLTNMLFSEPSVRKGFAQARATAEVQGVPLRLRLWIDPGAPELQSLPWETLHDPADLDSLLLTQEGVFFSRYVSSLAWRSLHLRKRTDLKALLVVANPTNLEDYALPPLDVEAELALAKAAMGDIPYTVLASPGDATLNNIRLHLEDGHAILYIVAYGRQPRSGRDYGLFLVSEDGLVDLISVETLAVRLSELKDPPQFVALGLPEDVEGRFETSQAILALRLIEAGIPSVLAMQQHVSQQTMTSFMSVLFDELWNHGQVDRAVASARASVRDRVDWWVPALFMRLKSGRIWSVPHQEKVESGDPGTIFMAPALPANYVSLPGALEQVVNKLLDNEDPADLVALTGAGGVGKTVLATAVSHEADIRSAFADGILWVNLGPAPGNLHTHLDMLVQTISGDRIRSLNLDEARAQWQLVAREKSLLVVIDDVWHFGNLTPFLVTSPGSKFLVTTRNLNTLPPESFVIEVGALTPDSAIQLLGAGLPETDQRELIPLARRLGNWPLALNLANSMLRNRLRLGQEFSDAIGYMNRALDRRGVVAFDERSPTQRNQTLALTLESSLELLAGSDRDRYGELAIFPANEPIPFSLLELLWGMIGGLDALEVEDLCIYLHSLSLIELDFTGRTVQLHGILRDYMAGQLGDKLLKVHRSFLDAYRDSRAIERWSQMAADDPYLWQHLAHHLVGARWQEELRRLLYDYSWLQAKLSAVDSASLLHDFDYLPEVDSIDALLIEAIRLSSPLIDEDGSMLGSQLIGRLGNLGLEDIDRLLAGIDQGQTRPWFRPLTAGLVPASRDAIGHSGPVNHVALSPDGRLALSASWDNYLKVWDIQTGEILRTLAGHIDRITSIAVTRHGKMAVSASLDGSLRAWNIARIFEARLEKGKAQITMEGHDGPIWAMVILDDDETVLSASWDRTIRLWDLYTGEQIGILEGHTDWVHCLAISKEGPLFASASWDGTMRIWDLRRGSSLHTLAGHTALINKIAIDPVGRWLVSASDDSSLIIWDLATGDRLHTLTGHSGPVTDLAMTDDGRHVVSASEDTSLRVWDLETGQELYQFTGHTGFIRGLSLSPGGNMVLSAAEDGFLKLWDLGIGSLMTSFKADGAMWACDITDDGRQVIAGDSLGRVHLLQFETPSAESDLPADSL